MPYKYKDPYRHKFEAAKYKVTNWHEYNQALIERGNITIWFDEKAIKSWYAKSNGKPCGQRLYSTKPLKLLASFVSYFICLINKRKGLCSLSLNLWVLN